MGEGAALLADVRGYLAYQAEAGVTDLALAPDVLDRLHRSLGVAVPVAPRTSHAERPSGRPEPAGSPTPGRERSSARVSSPAVVDASSLEALSGALASCRGCPRGGIGHGLLMGQGRTDAPDIMFVGPAPCMAAVEAGDCYAGPSGGLLAKMIAAMGYRCDEVYATHLCKCPFRGDRKPSPRELQACLPFLEREIALVKPRVIVAMGSLAVHALAHVPSGAAFGSVRGNWLRAGNIEVMPTFHPDELLSDPACKRPAWTDLQAVLKRLGRLPPAVRGQAEKTS